MGPTASGKTELALALAERLPISLISVDSTQVYRGLDIGSAKPDAVLRERHPHALVDIRDPADPYSAADFRDDALAAMDAARSAGRLPVLVGGTMLYFRVLEQGIASMPPSDPAVRAALDARQARDGVAALHAALAQVDPEAARRIDPGNPQRIKRALEVHEVSGRTLSWWWAQPAVGRDLHADFELRRVALEPTDRAALHQAVARRFDAMLAAGLIEEVRGLRGRPELHPGLPAIRSVGYRQVWSHLDGETTAEEMRERSVAATRQLARRQLTWLRSWDGVERVGVLPGKGPAPGFLTALLRSLESGVAPGGQFVAGAPP
jgi:tRNA dimethylallyltransferase